MLKIFFYLKKKKKKKKNPSPVVFTGAMSQHLKGSLSRDFVTGVLKYMMTRLAILEPDSRQ
jgi:hypothetical protein